MAQALDRETLDRMVDVILEYNGTPRRWLFEYPYNEFDSRAIINKAETAARSVAAIFEEQKK